MQSKYKIVLLGPPGSGKTTIEKVFFQRVNPFSLLNTPLEPTRGINTTSFSLFSSQLGVFDLAGQELDNWFSTQKEVFKETNIIICVFDILNSLEQIISILIKTIKICKEKCLNDYTIIILLHKIDLVNLSYVHQKSKSILEFLKTHYEIFEKIHLYRTSIAKAFFFSSYNIILKIIEKLFKKNIAPISKDEYNKLEIEFRILLMFDNNLKYNIKDLSHKFNIGSELALYHLKRLEMFGLIELLEDETIFMLTTRSDYIKEGIMKEQEAFRENKINLASKLFYTFMNLAEKAV